jgi:hypothetical protein
VDDRGWQPARFPHFGRIYLEVPRDTDRPSQFACGEPPAERRAQSVTSIGQHAANASQSLVA